MTAMVWPTWHFYITRPSQELVRLRPTCTQEKFPRTENFPKISFWKLKIFNFKIFFRSKICVGQSYFTKLSFCGKFSRVEMDLNKIIKNRYALGTRDNSLLHFHWLVGVGDVDTAAGLVTELISQVFHSCNIGSNVKYSWNSSKQIPHLRLVYTIKVSVITVGILHR
jgi:hypothetical protein